MRPGSLFAGRYRVGAVLGRGGMGTVYEVEDTRLGRTRAVKILHGHIVAQAHLRERFELEARLGGQIGSEFFVDVVDVGVEPDQGHPYLVMERLDGESLAQRLSRLGALPAAEVLDLLGQLARALDRMHAAGVVHRDLKPANLFRHVVDGGPVRLKVLDLGIAKVLGAGNGDSTGVAGTPAYMAPEQLRGRGVTAATDRYALGLIAYALLVGRSYWSEASALEPIAFGLIVVDGPREPASTRARAAGVALPAGFDPWFARATAAEPSRRFRSSSHAVRALAAALEVVAPAWLDETSPAIYEDTLEESTPSSPVTPDAGTEPATDDVRRRAVSRAIEPPHAGGDRAPRRQRVARWSVAIIGVLGAAGLVAMRWPGLGSHGARPSLAARDAVVACPILEVDAPDKDGWLGAAAAALVCERARVILGGRPARTRVPAELLGLPPAPSERFPVEPFAGVAARTRALTAARRHAVYVDGRVRSTAAGFEVELGLYDRSGPRGPRHRGEGRALIDAVRAAMAPMLADGSLPWATSVDPVISDHAGVDDLATQLDLLDLTLAFAQNAGQLATLCAEFTRRHRGDAPRLAFARYECRYTLGEREPALTLPTTVSSDGARALRARLAHMVQRRDDVADRAALTERYAAVTDGWGRSMIATTLSCLWENQDLEQATAWSLRAVEAEPRNPLGEWCAPWEQLLAVTYGSARQAQVALAAQAWRPWHPYGWWMDRRADRPGAERAYQLAPSNTQVAEIWFEALLAAGRNDDARRVAARLADGDAPVLRLQAAVLEARVDVAEARFAEGLRRLAEAGRSQPDDAGWVHEQRLAASVLTMQLAVLLGEDGARRRVVDEVVRGQPARRAPVSVSGLRRIAAVCAYADDEQVAPCFALVAQPLGDLDRSSSLAALVEGARAFAIHDLPAAARAWRPIATVDDEAVALLGPAMVMAFAAVEDAAFVDLVVQKAPRWAGASPAQAEAALAAEARRDRAAARALAAPVAEAWKLSSTEFPRLTELRRLARGPQP